MEDQLDLYRAFHAFPVTFLTQPPPPIPLNSDDIGGSNVIPRRARPGLAGLRHHTPPPGAGQEMTTTEGKAWGMPRGAPGGSQAGGRGSVRRAITRPREGG